jgi:predicted nucleic acid-binding protein
MSTKSIVLDANILIRAVLGRRGRELILTNAATVRFFAPDVAWLDARKYLPSLLKKRGVNSAAMMTLDLLETFIEPVSFDVYAEFQATALKRIGLRDADDWPILASAMALTCPIWTEDTDFFGTGVATWTTDRVELYFEA